MLYISWYTLYCLSNHRRFELLQASAALVVFCLAFSGVESSITGSQINCHSLMRICSRSDLLMIALQLQPQQDSLVSSFFSGKMTGMSAAGVIWCDGKSRYAVWLCVEGNGLFLHWMQRVENQKTLYKLWCY